MNFALAFCFVIVFKVVAIAFRAGEPGPTVELIEKMAAYGVLVNLALGIFNLIPLHPLDGHHILRGFLSFKAALAYDRTKHYGSYILMALIFISFRTGLLSVVIGVPLDLITNLAFTGPELNHFWQAVNEVMSGF